MRKEQRKVYLELVGLVDWELCAFCKFSKYEAYSPCDCGEPYCAHPLSDFISFPTFDNYYGLEPGQDCWAFRPAHDLSFCADIIGIVLRNGWQTACWWESKNGQWKITKTEYV